MNPSIQKFTALVQQHPANEMARFSLGKALFDAADYTGALQQFEVALQKRADWMVVVILSGKAHLSLGDKAKARNCFERALELAIAQNHEGPREEMRLLLGELA